MGCDWEGKFSDLQEHLTKACVHNSTKCEFCHQSFRYDELDSHKAECPMVSKECPLFLLGCHPAKLTPQELNEHIESHEYNHLKMFADKLVVLEKRMKEEKLADKPINVTTKRVEPDGQDHGYGSMVGRSIDPSLGFTKRDIELVEVDGPGPVNPYNEVLKKSSGQDPLVAMRYAGSRSPFPGPGLEKKIIKEEVAKLKSELTASVFRELKVKDEEIATLKSTVLKLEKAVRSKNADFEDRDFRLSLIENSNHDGSMVWKIPQFSQRMDDAKSGKYTSIFSLPFYTGRYGYKMCLRLYILGDGIGKGSYMSLFFVLMKGEFDNILQWPFTHKVTFKLINQNGGRDVIDTFQPDPMSSSFRKPKSDMNIASGCPRFVTHANLTSGGGFIADDTIFIKCIIDTTTIKHP